MFYNLYLLEKESVALQQKSHQISVCHVELQFDQYVIQQ